MSERPNTYAHVYPRLTPGERLMCCGHAAEKHDENGCGHSYTRKRHDGVYVLGHCGCAFGAIYVGQ